MNHVSEMCVHELEIKDYDTMYDLWCRTPGMGLSDADSRENIEKFLQRNAGLSFICYDADRMVGTVLCGHDGRRGYLYHVTVDMEYRGRGIGRTLVEKSLEQLKAQGIDKCHLFVFADNTIGNAFWTSSGWTKRGDIFVYSKSN